MSSHPRHDRIGPNAITQMASALEHSIGAFHTRELFQSAGLDGYLREPPHDMVAESEVIALHRAMRRALPAPLQSEISAAAGHATGEYLLGRRIPRGARFILHALSNSWGTRLLISAIRRNSWTFTGSGRLRIEYAPLPVFVLEDCPLCRNTLAAEPVCGYYAATFERLFQRLIDPGLCVTETACSARGDAACRFALTWRPPAH
jgi:divinyl protochlorophyllide a 8-vinyl-reductase